MKRGCATPIEKKLNATLLPVTEMIQFRPWWWNHESPKWGIFMLIKSCNGFMKRDGKMIRRQFEIWFASLTEFIYRRKYVAVCGVLILTLILSSRISDLRFDTRNEGFFHDDDPILIAYNEFRDTFGQDDVFIIGMRPEVGLNRSFLSLLHELHGKLEAGVPYLDDIQSLVNGRIVRAEGDTLFVEELMQTPPKSAMEVTRLKALIDRYPMYEKILVSADRSLATFVIKAKAVVDVGQDDLMAGFDGEPSQTPGENRIYLSNEQNVEIADAIQEIVSEYEGRGVAFDLSGTPAFVAVIQKAIERDLGKMMPLSFLVIVVFLAVLFRRLSGVVYPLIIVVLSLLSCLEIMALMDFPITNIFQILPTFLIVVGIADSVHILVIFYRRFEDTADKKAAVVYAISFAALPVLMTSVTTACGLLSFMWADVASVAQLGLIASMGVMLAFFYTVIVLPALIAIFPIKAARAVAAADHPLSDRIFAAIARATCRRPWHIVLLSTVILALAMVFASSVRLSHNSLTWFPEDAPIRVATKLLDKINGGTVTLEVTVNSNAPNGLHDPGFLSNLDEAVEVITGMEVSGIRAGKIWSIADVLKEINRALHEDKDIAYVLPTGQETIAQELILFESSGSDDLEDFTDSTYRIARISILAPFTDAVLYKDYVDSVEAYLVGQFPDVPVRLTGHISLFVQMIKNFITSLIKSYSFALLVITVLMILMIGRISIGMMSMVANVAPIVCIFGVMGILDIPLDLATILIGSIVLGLVVDDTIHFLHHFRRAYDQTGSVESAVYETLSTTGRALIITSLVLSSGFFVYTVSYLKSNVRFGLLSGTAVLFALAADFFLVPALLTIVSGKQESVLSGPKTSQPVPTETEMQ